MGSITTTQVPDFLRLFHELDTVHAWHEQVSKHDFGLLLLDYPEGFFSRLGNIHFITHTAQPIAE